MAVYYPETLLPAPSKVCNKCTINQPMSEFNPNKTYNGGFDHTCKTCRRAQRRARYKQNSVQAPPAEKTCTVCLKTYPGTFFPRSSGPDGRQSYCKDCKGLQAKLRLYNLTRERFLSLLADQGGGCAICGQQQERLSQYHVDHDHSHCSYGGSCGECVRGLLCSNCNVHVLPGYERMPADLRRCPVINTYLRGSSACPVPRKPAPGP